MSNIMGEYKPTDEDFLQLREWIGKTPYIIQNYDDEFLSAVVRKSKGSLHKSKAFLENLNALGMHYPEYFAHLDIWNKNMQEYLSTVNYVFMPRKAEDGSVICIISLNFENPDPYKFHVYEWLRYTIMSFYVQIWEKTFESGKIVIILDNSHINPIIMRQVTPVFIKKIADIISKFSPFRIQAVHYVNVPPIFEWMLTALKSFLKSNKLLERMHVHDSYEALHSYVPVSVLPKEYGGNQGNVAQLHREWKHKIESYGKKLKEESTKMRNLDFIRPKANDFGDMVGTFKALNFD